MSTFRSVCDPVTGVAGTTAEWSSRRSRLVKAASAARAAGIVAVGNRVLSPDLAVRALDFQLAATFILKVATGCIDCLSLGVVARAGSRCPWLVHGPVAPAGSDGPAIWLCHEKSLATASDRKCFEWPGMGVTSRRWPN